MTWFCAGAREALREAPIATLPLSLRMALNKEEEARSCVEASHLSGFIPVRTAYDTGVFQQQYGD